MSLAIESEPGLAAGLLTRCAARRACYSLTRLITVIICQRCPFVNQNH
jgi:hypothetical protein